MGNDCSSPDILSQPAPSWVISPIPTHAVRRAVRPMSFKTIAHIFKIIRSIMTPDSLEVEHELLYHRKNYLDVTDDVVR